MDGSPGVAAVVELSQLFQSCDRHQRGYIDRDEFAELCATFHIGPADAGAIFEDLDGDQDERISLEDFTRGFRDFLNPTKETKTSGGDNADQSSAGKKKRPLRRQVSAQKAWLLFSDRLGHHNIRHFLANSADRLYGIYEELHSRSTGASGDAAVPAQLIAEFEGLMDSLVTDARQLELERKRFEDMIQREREQHQRHLKSLEEELEAQVQRVAAVVKQDVEAKYEAEKRDLKFNMETEIAQLQAHLRLLKKAEDWLSREKLGPDSSSSTGLKEQQLDAVERTSSENRQLKMSLIDAQTTLALLQTELAQLKSHYSERDRLLYCEKEALVDLVNHQEHIQRQLELLHEANRSLQDTNDSLRAHMDTAVLTPLRRSPLPDGAKMSSVSAPTGLILPEDLPLAQHHSTEDSGHSSLMNEIQLDTFPSSGSPSLNHQSRPGSFRRSHGGTGPPSLHSELLLDYQVRQHHQRYFANRQYEPDDGPADRTFKVVFAGDASVGKSSFITRLHSDVFVTHTQTTLGVDFKVKTIRVDERNIVIQLWDTAGQERFRSITQSYFRKADGVMLLFDVTNERSFLNIRHWADCLADCKTDTTADSPGVPLVLCGTKSDLRGQGVFTRCVDPAQAERLAVQLSATYVETSAKNGTNLLEALVILTRQMMVRQDVEVQTLKLTDLGAKKKHCCSRS